MGDSDPSSPSKPETTKTETETATSRVAAWEANGHKETYLTYQIHCYYSRRQQLPSPNNDENSFLLVFLHGYPTCSYDWKETIELILTESTGNHSILAFDFLGFGLSSKPTDHNYTLSWHADLVEELIQRHNQTLNQPVFLIAHDMGTSVASELFARDLEGTLKIPNLKGALLFNGNMNMELAKLILGQRVLRSRFGSIFAKFAARESIFRWQLGSVFSKLHGMTQEQGEDQWKLMSNRNGHLIIDKLIQYTFEREKLIDRWHGALKNWNKSLHFAWGMEDPVATKEHITWLKELRGNDRFFITELDGLGHYPQLEDPKVYFKMLDNVLVNVK